MDKKKLIKRIFLVMLSLAVIAYTVYQIVQVSSRRITTEYALAYEYHETVTVKGFAVRDEVILDNPGSGIISYTQKNGDKVAAQSVVCEVFSSESAASARARIKEIDRSVEHLKSLQSDGNQFAASAALIDTKINELNDKILEFTEYGDAGNTLELKEELLENLNKKQIATGQTLGIDAYISSLESERASLEKTAVSSAVIETPRAGYFIASTDGCENVIAYDKIDTVTAAEISAAAEKTPEEKTGGAGKICVSNEWYIACVLDSEKTAGISAGADVVVTIPGVTARELKCTVHRSQNLIADKKTVLVFKCSQMDAELSTVRAEEIQIRIHSYDGLKVNSSALRMVDGVKGVYVISGVNAVFKPVNVQYSDSGFAVCDKGVAGSGGLKIYDEVITDAHGLYDGKVVK